MRERIAVMTRLQHRQRCLKQSMFWPTLLLLLLSLLSAGCGPDPDEVIPLAGDWPCELTYSDGTVEHQDRYPWPSNHLRAPNLSKGLTATDCRISIPKTSFERIQTNGRPHILLGSVRAGQTVHAWLNDRAILIVALPLNALRIYELPAPSESPVNYAPHDDGPPSTGACAERSSPYDGSRDSVDIRICIEHRDFLFANPALWTVGDYDSLQRHVLSTYMLDLCLVGILALEFAIALVAAAFFWRNRRMIHASAITVAAFCGSEVLAQATDNPILAMATKSDGIVNWLRLPIGVLLTVFMVEVARQNAGYRLGVLFRVYYCLLIPAFAIRIVNKWGLLSSWAGWTNYAAYIFVGMMLIITASSVTRVRGLRRLAAASFLLGTLSIVARLAWLAGLYRVPDLSTAAIAFFCVGVVFVMACWLMQSVPHPNAGPVSTADATRSDPSLTWANPVMRELRDALMSAYSSNQGAEHIARVAGIRLGRVYLGSAIEPLWNSLLEEAARQGKIPTLLGSVLRDQHVAAYHQRVSVLIMELDGIDGLQLVDDGSA